MTPFQVRPMDFGFDIFSSEKEIRLMQLTDLHYFKAGIMDKLEMLSLRKLCVRFQTDLIINTGDFFGRRSPSMAKKIASAFDSLVGKYVPWAFTWGNHDIDLFAFKERIQGFDIVEQAFSCLPHCLYIPTRQLIEQYPGPSWETNPVEFDATTGYMHDLDKPEKFNGFYGGSYQIRVFGKDTLKPAWHIFLLNSRVRNHISQKTLNWMRDRIEFEAEKVPCLCFFHIPTDQYAKLAESKNFNGYMGEKITNDIDNGRIHDFFRNLGVVKACFVGHDHVNNFWGDSDGIQYVYGRKSGIHGYGSQYRTPSKMKPGQKAIKIGGTQIILQLDASKSIDNTFTHGAVFSDGTKWNYQ